MTDKITEPMTPELTDPVPFETLAGDWKDDDAAVYDDDFSAANHGPVEASGVPHAKPTIKPTTRMLVRSVPIGNLDGAGNYAAPTLLMPADPNRKRLTVFAYGDTQMYFTLGSDKSDCFNGVNYPVYPATIARAWPTLDLDGHTGAVWVYAPTGATVITAVAVAVTE